jgi:putative membrane protein
VAAAGVLWALRAAYAQDETDEAPPGPPVTRSFPGAGLAPLPAPVPAGKPSAPKLAASAAAAPKAAAASAPRRAFTGYAAESARTVTRLPREERDARAFLRSAAAAARVDVEASRLAATRAHDPAVRAFADGLLQSRAAADAEMLHLLHGRGMAPPMMDNAQRKALVRLAKHSGPKFDREYLVLAGPAVQREEVALYERAAHDVSDPVLKAWIERQLPLLREQHAGAQRLQPREAQRARGADLRPATVSRVGQAGRQRVE